MAMPASPAENLLTKTSEELREMFCESCKKHGEDNIAEGFCINCQEYLCTTCLKYHRRLLALHIIQDKDNMPQDFCFEKCPNHQNELIKFYCQSCDTFLCSKCIDDNHKDCNEIKHMPTIVKDLEKGKEFQSVTQQLADLQRKVLLCNEKIKSNYEDIERFRNRCRSAIKKHREKLNNKLDVLEAKVEDEIERIRVKDETINKSTAAKNASLISDLDLLRSEIDHSSRDKCKMFMAMKKVQKEIQPIENETKRLMKETKITIYMFEPEHKIIDELDSIDGLGSLIKLDSKTKRTATYISDINVKSFDDKKVCDITGICSLSEGLLVLVDSNNKRVKLVDNLSNAIKSDLQLDAEPWDVTKIGSREVAVTLMRVHKILFISVQEDLSLCKRKEIKVTGDCRGIEQSDGNFIVSFMNPSEVQVLDTNGTVLQNFSKDMTGQNIFALPLYLAVCPDQSQIYVTDVEKSSVVRLSLKEKDISIYKDACLQRPVGIATDRTGAVYVCERDTHRIHHFSDDLEKVEILIDKNPELVKPYRCAVDVQANTMYIGLKEQNVIKKFTFKAQESYV